MHRKLEDVLTDVHATALALQRELAAQHGQGPRDRVHFPTIPGVRPGEDELIDAGEALVATLGAVASATGRLASQGVRLDTGGQPLSMALAGELVGFSPEDGRLLISVSPKGKENADAQRP